MKFDASALIPLVAKLGQYLRSGFEQYVTLKASGIEPSPELVAVFLESKMDTWNPKVRGQEVVDDETRAACARFLGGVAFKSTWKTPMVKPTETMVLPEMCLGEVATDTVNMMMAGSKSLVEHQGLERLLVVVAHGERSLTRLDLIQPRLLSRLPRLLPP